MVLSNKSYLLICEMFRMDCSLRELTSLIKEVNPEARKRGTTFEFSIGLFGFWFSWKVQMQSPNLSVVIKVLPDFSDSWSFPTSLQYARHWQHDERKQRGGWQQDGQFISFNFNVPVYMYFNKFSSFNILKLSAATVQVWNWWLCGCRYYSAWFSER